MNVGVVVSRHDHAPLFHFAYRGSRNGRGTARNLLVQLQAARVPPKLPIVDRGKPKEVRALLDRTEVPETPTSFVKRSATGGIPAVKVRARLWGAEREMVAYTNADKAVAGRGERNEALSRIREALTTLATKGAEWSKAKLHAAIR